MLSTCGRRCSVVPVRRCRNRSAPAAERYADAPSPETFLLVKIAVAVKPESHERDRLEKKLPFERNAKRLGVGIGAASAALAGDRRRANAGSPRTQIGRR